MQHPRRLVFVDRIVSRQAFYQRSWLLIRFLVAPTLGYFAGWRPCLHFRRWIATAAALTAYRREPFMPPRVLPCRRHEGFSTPLDEVIPRRGNRKQPWTAWLTGIPTTDLWRRQNDRSHLADRGRREHDI
jgi:hypothetical protein